MSDVNLRRLDGASLLVFRELMSLRKVTAAALSLGLSQSGVSHAIARLRVTFDDPLFNRIANGVEPTPRAFEIFRSIERLLDAAQDVFVGTVPFEPYVSTRRFRIGAPDHLLPAFAPRLMGALEHRAPRASISLCLLYGAEALSAVQRGQIDLAIGGFDQPAAPGDHEPLFCDDYVLVGRRGHPRLDAPLTLDAFWTLAFVAVCRASDPSGRAYPLNAALNNRGLVSAVVPDHLTAFIVASTTDAVVIAPTRLAEYYAGRLDLCCRRIPFAVPPLAIAAVRRSVAAPDAGVDWLLARLRECLVPEVAPLEPPLGDADSPFVFAHF